jgi:signal transduction histidine kinase
MELNKTKKWFYGLTGLAVVFILALGSWWLYLVFKLANKLSELHIPELTGNLIYMVQWEGFTFIVMLLILGTALLYIFIQDHKKTQAISAFFASMTHELKTPLASIRLQGQVIADLVDDLNLPDNQLQKYVTRLKEDTGRLEHELDKSLQLSRLEKGGNLNLHPVDIVVFLQQISKDYSQLKVNLPQRDHTVMADEFALKMIFRNLLENTIKHSKVENMEATIELEPQGNQVTITYFDNGVGFSGDATKLGQLFYKHNSPKGSGIGLYLVKKLCINMGGTFKVTHDKTLNFVIKLKANEQ